MTRVKSAYDLTYPVRTGRGPDRFVQQTHMLLGLQILRRYRPLQIEGKPLLLAQALLAGLHHSQAWPAWRQADRLRTRYSCDSQAEHMVV